MLSGVTNILNTIIKLPMGAKFSTAYTVYTDYVVRIRIRKKKASWDIRYEASSRKHSSPDSLGF